jgi:AraC-like DNA-binding protein
VDILSDVVAALRTGAPVSTVTEARAPWSLRFPPVAGAGFHVLVHGRCLLVPPDGNTVPLRPGDLVFLRRGSQHTLCSDQAVMPQVFTNERVDRSSYLGRIDVAGSGERTVLVCGAYRLEASRPHPLLAELPEVLVLPVDATEHDSLRVAVGQLRAETDQPRPGSDSIIAALIDLLLLQILRAWFEARPEAQSRGWAAALTDPALAPALRAMHECPARPWTVDQLAEHAGMSRAAFARRFAAMVGEPPLSYLTDWRMTTAGRLLRETDATIAAVAARSGYVSEFAFARAFKREYGVAPGMYRRQARRPSA